MSANVKLVYAGLNDIFADPSEIVDNVKQPRAIAKWKHLSARNTLYIKETYNRLSVQPQSISITKPKVNFKAPTYNAIFDNNKPFSLKECPEKTHYILDIVSNELFSAMNEKDIAAHKISYPGRKNIIINADAAYTVFSEEANAGHISSTTDYINHSTQEELNLLRKELNAIRNRAPFIDEHREEGK